MLVVTTNAFSQMGAGRRSMFGGELQGMTKYTAQQLGYGGAG
jgi:uncharacterized protein YbjQ (UPF0145 family)